MSAHTLQVRSVLRDKGWEEADVDVWVDYLSIPQQPRMLNTGGP